MVTFLSSLLCFQRSLLQHCIRERVNPYLNHIICVLKRIFSVSTHNIGRLGFWVLMIILEHDTSISSRALYYNEHTICIILLIKQVFYLSLSNFPNHPLEMFIRREFQILTSSPNKGFRGVTKSLSGFITLFEASAAGYVLQQYGKMRNHS